MPPSKFIEKVTQIILDNLSNEQFGVESLANIYGISRSQLFKKIKRATGKSASQFIREVRLDQARQLLNSTEDSVSEIAYKVGFSSPAYFASSFKDYFGYSPSEAKERDLDIDEPYVSSIEDFNSHEKANSKESIRVKRKTWIFYSSVALVVILLSVILYSKINKHEIKNDKTIAVIRFDNLTNDDTNQVFADGLAEEIINSLCKIHDLSVTARNSSFLFNKQDELPKISEVLNVNYILEGSIRKGSDKYRITVQLIDASDGYHVWSETYDRKLIDVLHLQEEISRIVAHKLEIQLTPNQDETLSDRITSDSLAYKLYHKSIAVASSNSIDDIKKGVELMNEAIEADSTFALAHARIVDLYRRNNFVGEVGWNKTTELMKKHVAKAMQLDPALGEAYIAKGYLAYREPNYEEAMNSFLSAVELSPNEPRAHFALAGAYIVFNKFKERYAALEKAYELDPLNPRFSLMAAQYFYYNKRDYNKGIQTLQNSINAFPDNDLAKCHLEMYAASLPNGDLVSAFKNYFEMYKKAPNERRVLNWLYGASSWLGLKPVSEMLNNKMRLNYPSNIHTFWNMYSNNAILGKHIENIDLVNFWTEDQNLSLFDKVNYLAEAYTNLNKPEQAKQIIEESFPNIQEPAFLIDAEKYNSLENIRLDILEKYINAERNLGNFEAVVRISDFTINYIDKEIKTLSENQILDYRFELYLKLIRASINDNVDEFVNVFEKSFFQDRHRIWMYDDLLTSARYHRFRDHPKFKALVDKVETEIQTQRSEVITFLKQENAWEESWDAQL